MNYLRQLLHLQRNGYVSLDDAFCIRDYDRYVHYLEITRSKTKRVLRHDDATENIFVALSMLNYNQHFKMIAFRNHSRECGVEKKENKFTPIQEFVLSALEGEASAEDAIREILRI